MFLCNLIVWNFVKTLFSTLFSLNTVWIFEPVSSVEVTVSSLLVKDPMWYYKQTGHLPSSYQKKHHTDSNVGENNAHPDLVSQRVEEGEDAWFGLCWFLDHDGDSQRHEWFGEVDHLLSDESDGQWGDGNVCLLQEHTDKNYQPKKKVFVWYKHDF